MVNWGIKHWSSSDQARATQRPPNRNMAIITICHPIHIKFTHQTGKLRAVTCKHLIVSPLAWHCLLLHGVACAVVCCMRTYPMHSRSSLYNNRETCFGLIDRSTYGSCYCMLKWAQDRPPFPFGAVFGEYGLWAIAMIGPSCPACGMIPDRRRKQPALLLVTYLRHVL